MGAGRKTQTNPPHWPSGFGDGDNSYGSARNLRKSDLGGAIFGCKDVTMEECLSKQLFGLPSNHYSFVRNIEQGLPLFLFNYSSRTMHGIFEAASHGQMNIDPYAWTVDGTDRTAFPAQVRVYTKMLCQPLSEKQFKSVIEDNYYTARWFWFELDHAQTNGLMSLFIPAPAIKEPQFFPSRSSYASALQATKWKAIESKENPSTIVTEIEARFTTKPRNTNRFESLGRNGDKLSSSSKASSSVNDEGSDNEGNLSENVQGSHLNAKLLEEDSNIEVSELDMERVLKKLREISATSSSLKEYQDHSSAPSTSNDMYKEHTITSLENEMREKTITSDQQANSQLVHVIKALTARTGALEKKQAESDKELQQLRDVIKVSQRTIKGLQGQVNELECKVNPSASFGGRYSQQYVEPEQVIYLIGGYNGSCWLSAFDSFSPFSDELMHINSMSAARSYTAAAALDGNIFVMGGGDGNSWYSSVECYSQTKKEWILCPNLSSQKGSFGGATLDNKLFAIGGGDGVECLTDVEMFDPILGRWISSPSLLHKRFSTAAVEHNRALYALGGYNGQDYLMSAERFDPREGYWKRLPNMGLKRGCLSAAVLNEKIYAIGGFDGEQMSSSVEALDPRLNKWMTMEPMNVPRGYAAAAVLGDTLFTISGTQSVDNVWDTMECYKEGISWTVCSTKTIGKRCFMSAIAL
ncbi:hypothetical protein Cni_G23579 [Canna indica]|uniref:DCD domain-containing protein n=1 Tax=Canna indica TaxID=4628 RepID=A0AAQ3KXG4_9LILI|nr:hypothetical protein Cni_G23579 [Canna indica]